MSTSIALLCEGKTDPPTVCALVDRVIDARTWVKQPDLDTHRHYRGFAADEPFMTWFDIDNLSAKYNVKSRGHFNGLPLHGDGHNTRKALVLLTFHTETPVDAIVIFRDGDDQHDDRREAILRVRDATPFEVPVVVGIANPMSECWVLHGFEPCDADEKERYDAEFERVGFDPRMRAHDLTDTNEGDARSPKRVLWALAQRDHARERACLVDTTQHVLRSRGEKTGLVAFLDELDERLPKAFQ
jgi:hypothetical protein